MYVKGLSTCFVTERIDDCREFYTRNLGARPTFDCGWYLTVEFEGGSELSFIAPQQGMSSFPGTGVMLNFKVQDVDSEHEKFRSLGLDIAMSLEDHPWGDRGFSVVDPVGNVVYVYSDREPSEEFRQFKLG